MTPGAASPGTEAQQAGRTYRIGVLEAVPGLSRVALLRDSGDHHTLVVVRETERVAHALGLALPPSLLMRAQGVIE